MKRDDTLWVLLLFPCTFTHSSWVSFSLPNICSFFFESHNLSPLWTSGQHGTQGQGGRLANGTELTSNITQRSSWKIGFFRLFHLWTPFSLLGYTVPLVQSKEISSIPQSLNATSKIQCVSAVCPAPFHRQTFQYRQRSREGIYYKRA